MNNNENVCKISIIVPIYNGEKFLKRCIDSIILQTYKNIEIILVDNNSTDSSLSICKDYKMIDNRIKICQAKDIGRSHAINIGIKNSTGTYIGFVDCDDYIEKDMYMNLVNAIVENESIDLVICGFVNKKENNEIIGIQKVDNEIITLQNPAKDFMSLYAKYGDIEGYTWNKLYKTSIIVKNIITSDVEVTTMQDLLFNCKYFLHCKKIKLIDITPYNYFYYTSSNIHKIKRSNFSNKIKVYEKIVHTCKKAQLTKSEYKHLKIFFATFLVYDMLQVASSKKYSYKERVTFIKSAINNKVFKDIYLNNEPKGIKEVIKHYLITHKKINVIILLATLKHVRQ